MIKKLILLIISLFIIGLFIYFIIPHANAANMAFEEVIYVEETETLDDNLIAAGNTITIDGPVLGDVIISGGTININNRIKGDLICLGGMVNLGENAVIDGDVYIVGGYVYFDGKSAGDASVFGFNFYFDGLVLGSLQSNSGKIELNGQIKSDVDVEANEIWIKDNAVIEGDFFHLSQVETKINNKSQIGGEIIKKNVKLTKNEKLFSKTKLYLAVLSFLGSLILGIFLILLFPNLAVKINKNIKKQFFTNFVVGLMMTVCLFLALVVLAMTIVGIPMVLVLSGFYGFLIYISPLFFALWIGSLLVRYEKNHRLQINRLVIVFTLGLFIYQVFRFVPIMGVIMVIFGSFISLGAILVTGYEEYTNN